MSTKETLASLGIFPKKSRGQNFLSDPGIIASIVRFSGVQAGDAVLEIGPGLGILTKKLLETGCRVLLVEVEERFCEHLLQETEALSAEQILCEDIRRVPDELIRAKLNTAKYTVISNVPYSISSELVLWTLEHYRSIKEATFLLQREFAERVAAGPGSRTYGSLSVLRTVYADVELGMTVSGAAFYPRARVESRLVKLKMRDFPLIENEALFQKVVRAAFGQRRKTLLNALSGSKNFGEKEEVAALLRNAGIDGARRAETLNIAEFAEITKNVAENGPAPG